MITQSKWFDRKFDFIFPVEIFPNIIEHLRGTPARLEEIVISLSPNVLTIHKEGEWSIQEQVGHLWDLEELWMGRLEDFLAGAKTLRPADLTNRKTFSANHNNSSMEKLLSSFRMARLKFVNMLEKLDEKDAAKTALHPRLEKPMRVIDMAYFIAEHDDHHLAGIVRMSKSLNNKK